MDTSRNYARLMLHVYSAGNDLAWCMAAMQMKGDFQGVTDLQRSRLLGLSNELDQKFITLRRSVLAIAELNESFDKARMRGAIDLVDQVEREWRSTGVDRRFTPGWTGEDGEPWLQGDDPAAVAEIYNSLKKLISGDELLSTLLGLGVFLAACEGKSKHVHDRAALCEALSRLHRLTNYMWLERVCGWLEMPDGASALQQCAEPYVEQPGGVVNAKLLNKYVREQLAATVPVPVLLEIDNYGLTLFGMHIERAAQSFRPAEWKILVCLARNCGKKVERKTLLTAVAGTADTRSGQVPPHINGLRKQLAPAIEAALPNLNPGITKASELIEGHRSKKGPGGPYSLNLRPAQVNVNVSDSV